MIFTTNKYTVIKFDIGQNRAIQTSPCMVSLDESRRMANKMKANGELCMSVHESTLTCIDIFDKEMFEEKQ